MSGLKEGSIRQRTKSKLKSKIEEDLTPFLTLNGENVKTRDLVINEMIKIIYPNWSSAMEERRPDPDAYSNETIIRDIQRLSEVSTANLKEHIDDQVYTNSQTKLSDSVKDFLSFITLKTGTRLGSSHTYVRGLQLSQEIEWSSPIVTGKQTAWFENWCIPDRLYDP